MKNCPYDAVQSVEQGTDRATVQEIRAMCSAGQAFAPAIVRQSAVPGKKVTSSRLVQSPVVAGRWPMR